jgi:hypothetical protein
VKKLLLLVVLPFINAFTALPHGNNYDSKVETDQFKPIFINSVKLDGEMGRRIDVTINNNLLVLDADKDFLLPFEARKGFGGGYVGLGKLIDATATLAANTKDPRVIALKEHLVNHVLGHQEADDPASRGTCTLTWPERWLCWNCTARPVITS